MWGNVVADLERKNMYIQCSTVYRFKKVVESGLDISMLSRLLCGMFLFVHPQVNRPNVIPQATKGS